MVGMGWRWGRCIVAAIAVGTLSGILMLSSGSGAGAATTHDTSADHGYWLVGSDGGVFSFGDDHFYGSEGGKPLQAGIVGIAPTPDRRGYWLVAGDGGVFSFGDAKFFGSIPGLGINPVESPNPHRLIGFVTDIASSSDGGGYLMTTSDGGVFAFGDAKFFGSCYTDGGCAGGINSIIPDSTGNGYWLVSSQGDVYSFGDATNYGESSPVDSWWSDYTGVGTPDGNGYWLLNFTGLVFTFGDATYYGGDAGYTTPSTLNDAIVATSDGDGYWLMTYSGLVRPFEDADIGRSCRGASGRRDSGRFGVMS